MVTGDSSEFKGEGMTQSFNLFLPLIDILKLRSEHPSTQKIKRPVASKVPHRSRLHLLKETVLHHRVIRESRPRSVSYFTKKVCDGVITKAWGSLVGRHPGVAVPTPSLTTVIVSADLRKRSLICEFSWVPPFCQCKNLPVTRAGCFLQPLQVFDPFIRIHTNYRGTFTASYLHNKYMLLTTCTYQVHHFNDRTTTNRLGRGAVHCEHRCVDLRLSVRNFTDRETNFPRHVVQEFFSYATSNIFKS